MFPGGAKQPPPRPPAALRVGGRRLAAPHSEASQPTHNILNPYYNDSIITYIYNATTKVSFTDDSYNHESLKHWYNVSLHYNEAIMHFI